MRLAIEKAVYGGAGLARHEGKAVFVPLTLPGETVEAEIRRGKSSWAEAQLVRVLEPSPHRVPPPCPHFGTCGGCHYQHASYDEQVRMKGAILRESLERARISNIPEIETISVEPFGYRNRIRLHVRESPFALGYLRGQSHALLPVEECPIAAPPLVDIMHALQRECAPQLSGWAREIELFICPSSGHTLLSVYTAAGTRGIARKLDQLWRAVQIAVPHVVGCAAFTLPKSKGLPVLATQTGETHIIYPVAGEPYRVGFGSFFQVNHFLVDRMVTEVCRGHSGELAWDLYAGVGLFARRLARSFTQVTAVEAAPASVADLRTNMPGQHITAETTLRFLHEAAGKPGMPRPDAVVLDPPRAGLGAEAADLLARIHPPHVTYVSCDPATLARDLFSLLKSGYRLQKLQLIDLFPQTFHLETIAHVSLP